MRASSALGSSNAGASTPARPARPEHSLPLCPPKRAAVPHGRTFSHLSSVSVTPCSRGQLQRTASASVETVETETKTSSSDDVLVDNDGTRIIEIDGDLGGHRGHLDFRWNQFQETLKSIEAAEGDILNFSEGHKYLGFTREENCIVYREWAPVAQAAALIGDFNNWEGTWMEKDEFGVWTCRIPDGPGGEPGIPHGSRLKIKLQHPGGWWVDLIPAYIEYATVPQGIMGATYDGVYWNPPKEEKYEFKHKRPEIKGGLRIYEAHVGMSSEDGIVASYDHFRENVLPRIASQGYNCVQLMAIQEHAYYGSFGYHITNPFACSSRSGNPESLKALIDTAHSLGIVVLLDVVHSHISKNQVDGLAGFDMGQSADMNYFNEGEAGYQKSWDSRCLNYRNWEVLRYLLSNLRYWIEEYQFDGYRFDGVTSMLYQHHGIGVGFSGNYDEYFGPATNVDAIVYLMLGNYMLHKLLPEVVTIAEDVSGMPALCRPVQEGGVGFDYRLAMAIPDKWIKLLKHRPDEHWGMYELVGTLCNRRYTEKTIGYAESHDQALVGDKTIAFWLMDAEMYTNMSKNTHETAVIERGIAMHKLIRGVTMVLGGEGWLNFMGNEFGHPEWLDFPREGNDWSHHYCRRQWSLADREDLRYTDLNEFDKDLMALDEKYNFISHPHQHVSFMDDGMQVMVAERGDLMWVFNFSPHNEYHHFKVGAPNSGNYRIVLDSDGYKYGGKGRVAWDVDHPTEQEEFMGRGNSCYLYTPPRSVQAYAIYHEPEEEVVEATVEEAAEEIIETVEDLSDAKAALEDALPQDPSP